MLVFWYVCAYYIYVYIFTIMWFIYLIGLWVNVSKYDRIFLTKFTLEFPLKWTIMF